MTRVDDLRAAWDTAQLAPVVAAVPDLLAVVAVLEAIARKGVSFDAKGSRAREINDMARAALAAFEEGGKP